MIGDVHQMVVIVLVDADVDKAEDVREKQRKNREERRDIITVRDAELQHHNRDEDSDHTVTKGFEASGFHGDKSITESAYQRSSVDHPKMTEENPLSPRYHPSMSEQE